MSFEHLVGLDELKEFLGITDNSDDDVLASLRDSAAVMVQNWTGYTYPESAAALVEFVMGNGSQNLWLTLNPAADPSQVLERAKVGDSGTAITGAQSDGWVRRGTRLVRKGDAVWILDYEYQVTYVGGYVEAPEDVALAIKQLVSATFGQGQGLKSESLGSYSYTISEDQDTTNILQMLPRRGVFA